MWLDYSKATLSYIDKVPIVPSKYSLRKFYEIALAVFSCTFTPGLLKEKIPTV